MDGQGSTRIQDELRIYFTMLLAYIFLLKELNIMTIHDQTAVASLLLSFRTIESSSGDRSMSYSSCFLRPVILTTCARSIFSIFA